MRPITHSLHQSMLDRIEMHIIDVSRKVAIVTDGVLPKPPLPKREIAIWPALEIKVHLNQSVAECPLILRHQLEKSASFAGNVMMVWR